MRWILILVTMVLAAACCDNETKTQCPSGKIATIGGCDRTGDCGVVTDTGYYCDQISFPVVGIPVTCRGYTYCKKLN